MGTKECFLVAVAIAAVVATNSGEDSGLEQVPVEDVDRQEEAREGPGALNPVETMDGNDAAGVVQDDVPPLEEIDNGDTSESQKTSSEADSVDSPALAKEQAESHSGELVPETDHEVVEEESQVNSHVDSGELHGKVSIAYSI
jgi:hypothetical protein